VYLENIIKNYEKPAGKLPVNVYGVVNTIHFIKNATNINKKGS
jgi:hypothetical protein